MQIEVDRRAFLLGAATSGAALLPVPALSANDGVRGINVSLLPPGKSSLSINVSSPTPSDIQALLAYNAKRLAVLSAAGFDLVRLRFHMALIRPSATAQQRELALRAVADFVKRASDKGVQTLVALFPENGHDQHDLICDRQDEFLQTLDVLLRALPDSPLVGVEPLNEPFTGCGAADSPKRWVNLQQVIYRRVRASHPRIIFVVSGDNWGGDLLKLDPSPYRADRQVLFSLHFYDPLLFTSQGVNWNFLPPFNRFVHDLPWPYRAEAVAKVRGAALSLIDADSTLDAPKRTALKADLDAQLEAYARSGTEQTLAGSLDKLAAWATSNGVGNDRIFLGEFGVIRPSQDTRGRITPGADAWIGTVARLATERGFQWAIWDLDTSFAIGFGHNGDADKISDQFVNALHEETVK
ncbi:MAG: cellulase family glycosylhydrolase [Azospirillaceae bacterium]|nr:cellulase family glycosylhydrolase [Azospirillaceae bacterium]